MSPSRFFIFFFLFVSVSGAPLFPSLRATMVLPLDLEQMTDQAGRIFVGQCLGVSSELDEHQMPATYVRFYVLKGLKGITTGEEILIKQYGTSSAPLKVREGEKAIVPSFSMMVSPGGYDEGGEYLLFIYPESSLGFTSPVGGGQGKFLIVPSKGDPAKGDPEGSKLVVNPFANRFLKGFSLPPNGGGIDLDRITGKIESLVGR